MPGIDFSPVRNWLAYWHPMQLSVTRRCLLCDISQDALECQCLPEKQFKGWIKVVSHSCPCIRPCALILGGGVILMEEIQHQLIGSLSHHYLPGFLHPKWCRIPAINSGFLGTLRFCDTMFFGRLRGIICPNASNCIKQRCFPTIIIWCCDWISKNNQ